MRTPTKIRVAHVSLGLATGGQEKLLVEFARCADRERFELLFVSLTDRGSLAEAIEELGWPVVALHAPPGLKPSLVLRLRNLFRERALDVVHTHDDRPLIYGVPAARWAGLRVIHTHHHGKRGPTSRRQEWLTRWAGRMVHRFVTVSHDSARYLLATGLPPDRLQTIWNGIDLERFAYVGPDLRGPALTVARLSPEKDLGNLLRAVAQVVKRDPSFRLEIAGEGPCREELLRLTADLGLAGVVRFLGEVRDIPTLLGRASLFVLPSRSEGISLTLLEAMAHGLPIVTTRVGGNPEVVVDGQTGLLVPAEDPSALADAILRVRRLGEDSVALGRAGRRRVEESFDVRGMVAQYERLYLGQPAATPSAVLSAGASS